MPEEEEKVGATNKTSTLTPVATSDKGHDKGSKSKEKAKEKPATFLDMLQAFQTVKPELKESWDTSSEDQVRLEVLMLEDYETNKQEDLNSFFQ